LEAKGKKTIIDQEKGRRYYEEDGFLRRHGCFSGILLPPDGIGTGMMGPGYGWGPQYQQPPRPLDKQEVRSMLDFSGL